MGVGSEAKGMCLWQRPRNKRDEQASWAVESFLLLCLQPASRSELFPHSRRASAAAPQASGTGGLLFLGVITENDHKPACIRT